MLKPPASSRALCCSPCLILICLLVAGWCTTKWRNPQGELEAVAIGFNFSACFLTVLWSFCVNLYWVTGLTLAAPGLTLLIPDTGNGHHWFALGLLLSAGVFGAWGNLWREKNMLSRGFIQVDALLSCNPDQAKVACKRQIEEAAPGFGQ